MGKRILVVDDEKLIVKGIRFSLEQEGMEVDCAYDGEEALEYAKACEYDLVLLDVMLPKLDGFQVCQQIREFSDMPVVMLTAKSEDMDKILGLEYGADDYITKPFNILEVKARIKAIMRRTPKRKEPAGGPVLIKGSLKIDCESRRVFIGEREINLTAKEFDVLELLAMNPNKVYSRENLLNLVWGYDYPGDARTVDVHIRRLREKIEMNPSEPKYVHTKWEWVIISKIKYQFVSNRKIIGNMRFCVILCTMLAGLIPCLATLFGIVAFYESRAVELRTAEIQNQCTILSNQLSAYGYLSDPTSEVIDSNLTQLTNIYNGRVMIMDEDLCVIKDTYNLDEGKTNVSESVVRCMRTKPTNHYDKKNHYIEVTSPINIPGKKKIDGVILASVSTDSIEVTKQVFYTHGGVVVGIAAIFLAVFGVALANKLVKPIHKITGAIENVSEGYSDDVLHVDTFAETSQLSEAFNKMLGRLKQLDDSREEFVSNVSHELKTPMTSMKVLADSLLEQENLPVEMYREFMEDIAKEIDRENQIITDLLSLVKMNRTGQTMNIQQVNINDLLEQILKRLKPIAEKKNVEMVMESFRPVSAEIDETKFTLAVSNLVENAIKYNHENGWVHVSLNADHKYFYLKVEDSGLGIPQEDQAHIFERFYRVDKSHSREIGGTGLGLAIARNAVIVHRGSIKVHSNEGEGTTFTVRIPLIYTTVPEGVGR